MAGLRFVIKGGYLIDPASGKDGLYDLLIEAGQVVAVERQLDLENCPQLNARGKIVFPGLVDIHAHLREPGLIHKECIATGTAAAIAGGITSLACMPNTCPVLDCAGDFTLIEKKARLANLSQVYPFSALTLGQNGQELVPLEELAKRGIKGFSDDGKPVRNSRLVYEALQRLEKYQRPVISHCEDLDLAAGGVVHLNRRLRRLGLPGIPPAAEAALVARDLVLAAETEGWIHIAHVSCQESVALIAEARARGVHVTAEVTPHHLLLTQETVHPDRANTKVNPPLREEKDRRALRQALREGIIDIIATDHAPHAAEEKNLGFLEAPFGISGLETALPLLLTACREQRWLDLPELILGFSTRPANFLQIPAGQLAPGFPADLVIADLERPGIIDTRMFYSRGRNSPFQGWHFKGKPCLTMVGGIIKMLEGRVHENIPFP